ncbi:SDR family NAD(P)-dependent oxidoreductase [Microlunatus speluncae]|uniref:SDR family NAD(P)-dependent oxidoreductase n=1 Tax=Microlunatus speluncae TaxID=2594267 RepID=UPI00126647C3|nr:SDR family NAD(P)-dependent oxidoreductase [Microlunatus speluncae]
MNNDPSKDLTGRVALITGAGRGIGRREAHYLAARGARVVINDPGGDSTGTGADGEVAAAVVREIIAVGREAVGNTDSVTDWQGARRLVATAVEAFGDLHIVINNAGTNAPQSLMELTEDAFDGVLAVKLKGTVAVSHWAAQHWRDRHAAGSREDRVIINTSSGSGLLNPLPLASAYAAANAGVGALTIVHALELARYGIRVNAIAPSMVRTRLTADVPGMDGPAADAYDPLDPVHQAVVAAYLARADCPLTGQVLTVRGSTVIPNRNWSAGEPVTKPGAGWEPAELGRALAAAPLDDQFAKLLAALGPVYGVTDRDQLQELLNTVLDNGRLPDATPAR